MQLHRLLNIKKNTLTKIPVSVFFLIFEKVMSLKYLSQFFCSSLFQILKKHTSNLKIPDAISFQIAFSNIKKSTYESEKS